MVFRGSQLPSSIRCSCRICAAIEFFRAVVFWVFAENAVLPKFSFCEQTNKDDHFNETEMKAQPWPFVAFSF